MCRPAQTFCKARRFTFRNPCRTKSRTAIRRPTNGHSLGGRPRRKRPLRQNPRAHDPYAAFRVRAFSYYSLGNLISVIGRQMLVVAIEWEMYQRTHSATALGLVGLVIAVPVVLLSLARRTFGRSIQSQIHHSAFAGAQRHLLVRPGLDFLETSGRSAAGRSCAAAIAGSLPSPQFSNAHRLIISMICRFR